MSKNGHQSRGGRKEKTIICMLGESIVIVPNDSLDGGDWLGDLSSAIEARGFSTFPSQIGALR